MMPIPARGGGGVLSSAVGMGAFAGGGDATARTMPSGLQSLLLPVEAPEYGVPRSKTSKGVRGPVARSHPKCRPQPAFARTHQTTPAQLARGDPRQIEAPVRGSLATLLLSSQK